jgi:hypothetical protein
VAGGSAGRDTAGPVSDAVVGNGTGDPGVPEHGAVDATGGGSPEHANGVGDPDPAGSSTETGESPDGDDGATTDERAGGDTTDGETTPDTTDGEADAERTERRDGGPTAADGTGRGDEGPPSDSAGPGDRPAGAKPLAAYPTPELLGELDRRREAGGLTDRDRERLRALLPEDAGGNGAEDSDGVDPRIAGIQERLAAVEALLGPGPGDGGTSTVESADLEALSERVAAIGDEVATTRERVEAFGARLDALEDRVAGADGGTDDGEGVTARVDTLEGEVATLREEVRDGGSDGPGYDAWPG